MPGAAAYATDTQCSQQPKEKKQASASKAESAKPAPDAGGKAPKRKASTGGKAGTAGKARTGGTGTGGTTGDTKVDVLDEITNSPGDMPASSVGTKRARPKRDSVSSVLEDDDDDMDSDETDDVEQQQLRRGDKAAKFVEQHTTFQMPFQSPSFMGVECPTPGRLSQHLTASAGIAMVSPSPRVMRRASLSPGMSPMPTPSRVSSESGFNRYSLGISSAGSTHSASRGALGTPQRSLPLNPFCQYNFGCSIANATRRCDAQNLPIRRTRT